MKTPKIKDSTKTELKRKEEKPKKDKEGGLGGGGVAKKTHDKDYVKEKKHKKHRDKDKKRDKERERKEHRDKGRPRDKEKKHTASPEKPRKEASSKLLLDGKTQLSFKVGPKEAGGGGVSGLSPEKIVTDSSAESIKKILSGGGDADKFPRADQQQDRGHHGWKTSGGGGLFPKGAPPASKLHKVGPVGRIDERANMSRLFPGQTKSVSNVKRNLSLGVVEPLGASNGCDILDKIMSGMSSTTAVKKD